MVTAGQRFPVAAGRGACWPELSEERVREAPLPAVERAAKGSAIARGSEASNRITAITTTETIQDTLLVTRFSSLIRLITCFYSYYV